MTLIKLSKKDYCYVGIKPCGCCCAAMVDDEVTKKDQPKELGKWIRWGWTIERKTVEWVRINLELYCPHEKKKEGNHAS